MNDKTLIGRVIANKMFRHPESLSAASSAVVEELTDAILAAIGDRLLPELPEWVDGVNVQYHRLPDEQWRSRVVGDIPDTRSWNKGNMVRQRIDGNGPTIPAAIRDALEADQ